MDEALDPKNRGRFVAKATRDYAQAALNATQKNYRKHYAHDDLDSLQWRVELPAPAEEHPDEAADDASTE